ANNFRPCGRQSAPSSPGSGATAVRAATATSPRGAPSTAPRGGSIPSRPSTGSGWPRFHYDAVSSGLNPNEKTLNYTNVGGLRVKWKAAAKGPIESSPAVSGGLVYVGSDDDALYAFKETTGQAAWSYKTGGLVRSSPAVANGVVFVGSDDGYLYALNAT